jgi:Zn-finger nucleic acid-binding protein
MNCPNCHAVMTRRPFDRLYGRLIDLDICHACQVIWFDDQELLQLAPRSTLELLAAIATEQHAPRTALAATLRCPRCATPLEDTHDLQRATRFTYFRCPAGHGRILTYYQFLRAKNFVRVLNADEVSELRRRIKQVNCANCGAPVDLNRGICEFCRTPVAILDPDQMQKAVAQLKATAEAKSRVDPMLPLTLAKERAAAEAAFAKTEPPDLLAEGLRALRALLS